MRHQHGVRRLDDRDVVETDDADQPAGRVDQRVAAVLDQGIAVGGIALGIDWDDEPAVRQLFAQALNRAGYSVYEARNGQEAIKVFDQHGGSIDMLLTDMRMPYMGGAELAHHLRGRRRSLKLLCISGYPGNLDAELAIDFLAKPFSRDDLLKKVREVLDK